VSPLDVVVAGLGSAYRGDDAVGPLVAELFASVNCGVRDVGPLEEPLDLLGRFDGADLAIVIDAVRSGAPIGTVRVVDVDLAYSHDVLRLARAVGRAPRRLVLVAVEGEAFELGSAMSVAVSSAVPEALRAVTTLIERNEQCA
jgi:hydrogenase maturation protease